MRAKGLPAKLLWAELAGKATGSCKGKGGPMHLTYPSKGCMVTTGIVGASMPIACGLALAAQLRGETRVTVANRSEEHTSELQSLMRISYAVFCLKKKKNQNQNSDD